MKRFIPLLGISFIVFVFLFGWSRRDRFADLKLPNLPGLERIKTSSGIDIDAIKPALWRVYGKGLFNLSIDDDEDNEWMLFYRYDGGNIGGIIYDPQTTPLGNENVPLPDRPATFVVPYRLLPDYQSFKATGYLGDDKVIYRTAVSDPQAEPIVVDRLLVRGIDHDRTTRFSVFWWIDEKHGYGGAHANTAGWFSLSHDRPDDWERWSDPIADITELWAWEPLHDRANLCRRVHWHLDNGDPEHVLFTRHFVAGEAGDITFCHGQIPEDPAFPEAQVLAYLNDGDGKRLWQHDNDRFPRYENAVVSNIIAPPILDVVKPDEAFPGIPVRVEVDVDFTVDGVAMATRWTVAMIRPETVRDTTHWRIVNVSLR